MRSRAMILLPLLVLALGAKKTKTAPETTTNSGNQKAEVLSAKPTADGLIQEQVDLNGDGKPEITNYWRERADAPRLLVRKEIDLNRDGNVDVRTTFDDAGLRVQEEMNGDFEGTPDWIDHYIDGKRSYSEVDTDWNGNYDLFKYYEAGKVRRKERDTNADGRVDFWEYLDEQGQVIKTGQDTDNDGKMDVRDQ